MLAPDPSGPLHESAWWPLMPMPIPTDMTARVNAQLKQVERAYREIPEALDRDRVWRSALSGAFAGLVSTARNLTPVKTGRLRRSVAVWPKGKRRGEYFAIGFGNRRPDPYHKALGVEFGNARVPNPGRALRTAWEQHEQRLIVDAADMVRREIAKVQEKLAKRLRAAQRRTRPA